MTGSPQPTVRLRVLLASMLALSIAQLGRSSPVQASCVGPELELLWSYPEAGAEQVPTNITIWAVTSLWSSQPAATLDGQPVVVQEAPSFSGVYLRPQNLAPDSDHTLVLDYTRSPNLPMPGAPIRFEIKFKTGAGPTQDTVAEPVVTSGAREITDYAAHDCAAVISAQDCFDTGQDALLSLEVEEDPADATFGWLLKARYPGSSAVWPARCGAPSVYLHNQESLCLQVQRIGAGGRLSKAVDYCSASTADMPATDAGHGGSPSTNKQSVDAGPARTAEESRAPADAPAAAAGCSTVSGARTAARAFWAIVAIALLLAHSQRQRRRRPRGVTPSRRFRI